MSMVLLVHVYRTAVGAGVAVLEMTMTGLVNPSNARGATNWQGPEPGARRLDGLLLDEGEEMDSSEERQ